jgi:hypothetical protein
MKCYLLRFDLPTVGLQFVVLFGYVLSCRRVIVYRRFREGCCLHVEGLAVKDQEPEHGIITLFRNVGNCLLGDTAKHNVGLRSCILWNLSRGRSCGGHERRVVRKKEFRPLLSVFRKPVLSFRFLIPENCYVPSLNALTAWTWNVWRIINRL